MFIKEVSESCRRPKKHKPPLTDPEAAVSSALPPPLRHPHFPETSETKSLPPEAHFIICWWKCWWNKIRLLCWKAALHLQVAVLQVSDPKGLLTIVEYQHGLHPVHKQLQALLQGRDMIGQTRVLVNLVQQTMWQNKINIKRNIDEWTGNFTVYTLECPHMWWSCLVLSWKVFRRLWTSIWRRQVVLVLYLIHFRPIFLSYFQVNAVFLIMITVVWTK